jgi:two-component system LytT family response regulator
MPTTLESQETRMLNAQIAQVMPRLLFNREIGLSMAGWILFLTGAALYCLVYNQLVLVSPTSFMNSFLWSLREYAVWLAITPVLFSGLRRIHSKTNTSLIQSYGLLIGAALFIALTLHMAMDAHKPSQHSTIANLVNLFPSQLSVLSLLIALWHLFFRAKDHPQTTIAKPDNYCDQVRVMKGNGETLISWASVDFISAAGNYMELSCGTEKYLLRITLKELEQQLPTQQFIRVHRSHIVNIAAIRRIGSQTAGNGFIELRNNHLVPLSKGYKQALSTVQFVPDSSH